MSAGDEIAVVRRVVLALDACGPAGRAVRRGVQLAARLRAELHVLVVEDENLVRLAGLPFGQRFARAVRGVPLELGGIESEWRSVAARTRRLVEEAARGHAVRWDLHVARGRHAHVLQTETSEGDLVVLAWTSHATGRPGEGDAGLAVHVLAEETPAGRRALASAREFANDHGRVVALVPIGAPSPAGADEVRRIRDAEPATLRRAILHRQGDLLVLPAGHPAADAFGPGPRQQPLPCPVVLVP